MKTSGETFICPWLLIHWLTKELSRWNSCKRIIDPGGGNDIPWLRVPAARIFRELPCFGVKFSNIHPASESDFQGFFQGEIYCYANFFCYANFSIVFKPIFGGRGKLLERKDSSQRNNVSKHRNELFSKETLTNSCTVCHIRTLNMLKISKLGLISWTKDK